MRAASAPAVALLGATGLLVGAALFFSGGASFGPLVAIGTAALLVLAAAVAAVAVRILPRPRLGRAAATALGSLAALVAWEGVSIAWSIQPSQTWRYFDRGVVYLAFCCLGVLVGAAAPRAARTTAYGLAALLAALLGWALLTKIVPPLYPDYGRLARLRAPVDYWNALALLADGALVLALWLGERRRVAGALLAYAALVTCVLTYSRFGIALAVVFAAVWLALRRTSVPILVAAVPPAAAVLAFALTRPGIADDLTRESTRVRDGALFAVALVVGAALVVALLRVPLPRVRFGRLVALAVLVALVAAFGATAKSRWHEFCPARTAQLSESQARLGSFNSSNRCRWWKESLSIFASSPGGGSGAGTFQLADRIRRYGNVTTIEPHNTALQFLAETGIVGFLLWLGFFVAAAVSLRAREWRDRGAATALGVFALLFFVHMLADMDWSFVALEAPLVGAVGVLLSAERAAVVAPRRNVLVAAGAVFASLALVYSLLAPWLAEQRVNDALDAALRGDSAAALADVRSARSLDPFSVDAVTQQAAIEEARGHEAAARALYEKATRIEPENPETWFQLGDFELRTGHARAAYVALNHSFTLDAWGPAGVSCGPLDVARYRVFKVAPPTCPRLRRPAHP